MSHQTFPLTYFPVATQRQFATNLERIRGKPYEKYFDGNLWLREAVMPAIRSPMDPADSLDFKEINSLLEPGYHRIENGFCELEDGTGSARRGASGLRAALARPDRVHAPGLLPERNPPGVRLVSLHGSPRTSHTAKKTTTRDATSVSRPSHPAMRLDSGRSERASWPAVSASTTTTATSL
jgi:hypothetical protein